VTERGAERPAGHAGSMSRAWWQRPPPIPSPLAAAAATGWPGHSGEAPRGGAAGGSGSEPGANARLARKEPATRSARRSGRLAHAETTGDTGSNEHATHAGISVSLRGWAGHPCHSAPCSSRPEHAVPAEPRQTRQRSAGRSPSRPARITRWAGRRVCLSGDSCLLE
jgi:hypothetical protein